MTSPQAASVAADAANHTQNGDDTFEAVSLFPQAPQPSRGKLAEALARAAADREAKASKSAAYATHLDEVVFSADTSERDTIIDRAEAIEAAALEISTDSDLKRVLIAAQMDHAEMTRKAMEIFGADYIRTTDPKKLDVVVAKACSDNAMLAEAVRLVCAAAGTVRVTELIPVQNAAGHTVMAKRFVDVGDEEPGQAPEITPKYLLTAALKAAVRFSNLLEEAKRQHARAEALETECVTLRKQLTTVSARQKAQDAHYQALCRAERERGEEAAYATPRVVVTNGTQYLKLRPGMDPRLSWAYGTTEDPREAVTFDTVEQAGAILNQITMFPRRVIHIDILSTLSVARVVTEDHGVSNGDSTPTHYPAMIPLPKGEPIATGKGTQAPGKQYTAGKGGVTSYNVSAGDDDDDDDDAPVAKPSKAPSKPVKATQAAQALASASKVPSKPQKPVSAPTKPKKPGAALIKALTKPVKPVKVDNRAKVLAAQAADRATERKRLLDASRKRSASK
jgi:hypothetical protein